MDKQKIKADELLNDIKVILSDELVATLNVKGETLRINFSNGQRFILQIKEVVI